VISSRPLKITVNFEKPRRPGPQRPRRPGLSGVQCPSGLTRFGEVRADQRLVLVFGQAILRMALSQFSPRRHMLVMQDVVCSPEEYYSVKFQRFILKECSGAHNRWIYDIIHKGKRVVPVRGPAQWQRHTLPGCIQRHDTADNARAQIVARSSSARATLASASLARISAHATFETSRKTPCTTPRR